MTQILTLGGVLVVAAMVSGSMQLTVNLDGMNYTVTVVRNSFLRVNVADYHCSYYHGRSREMDAYLALDQCSDGSVRGMAVLAGGGGGGGLYELRREEGDARGVVEARRVDKGHKRKKRWLDDLWEWGGYFLGDDDEEIRSRSGGDGIIKRGEFVCNGPYCEYFKVTLSYP